MPLQFDGRCWGRVEAALGEGRLARPADAPGRSIRRTGVGTRVLGRRHGGHPTEPEYFFNVESRQIEALRRATNARVAFACGPDPAPAILLVPLDVLLPHVPALSVTARQGFTQHNVRIVVPAAERYELAVPGGVRVGLTGYRL
jgi:hypothetical protein